jgi:curved DNA-binding protein CbpA
MEELKEAYRDAISVWHPDRFSANPRLKRKAERKAAEINKAYEMVAADISRRHHEKGTRGNEPKRPPGGGGSVERFAETGTTVALHLGYAVYSAIRKLTSSK